MFLISPNFLLQVIDLSTKECIEAQSDLEASEFDINFQAKDENTKLKVETSGFPDCIGGAKNQSFIKLKIFQYSFKTFHNENKKLQLEDLRLLKNHSTFCLDQIHNDVSWNST